MNESNNDNNNCDRCINPYKVFNGGGGWVEGACKVN